MPLRGPPPRPLPRQRGPARLAQPGHLRARHAATPAPAFACHTRAARAASAGDNAGPHRPASTAFAIPSRSASDGPGIPGCANNPVTTRRTGADNADHAGTSAATPAGATPGRSATRAGVAGLAATALDAADLRAACPADLFADDTLDRYFACLSRCFRFSSARSAAVICPDQSVRHPGGSSERTQNPAATSSSADCLGRRAVVASRNDPSGSQPSDLARLHHSCTSSSINTACGDRPAAFRDAKCPSSKREYGEGTRTTPRRRRPRG